MDTLEHLPREDPDHKMSLITELNFCALIEIPSNSEMEEVNFGIYQALN